MIFELNATEFYRDTIKTYSQCDEREIIILFMKVLAISSTIYMYYSYGSFINKMTANSLAWLNDRMNHISRELRSIAIIDNPDQMATMRVVVSMSMQKESYSKMFGKFIKHMALGSDVASVLTIPFESVATCSLWGNLAKLYEKKTYIYNKVMDATNECTKTDVAVHSSSKLNKFTKDDQHAEEKRNLYKVINAIKTVPISSSADRYCVRVACMACGATHKLKTCSRCKVARFCNYNCVRTAWAMHKPHCNRWAAERMKQAE
jgi:hypothetical protein